jgi:DNA-binding response OmpR family regulator
MKLQTGSIRLEHRLLYLGNNRPPVVCSPKEARLLATLMQHPGQVVSRAQLMKEVWQTDYLGDTRTLDVHIYLLRQKLEQDPANPRLLVTERGLGYRLNTPDSSPEQ